MRHRVARLGVIGLLALAIAACGGAASESQTESAPSSQVAVGELEQEAGHSHGKPICVADPPVNGPNRQVFQINDHLTAFYDGRNTERVSPEPNWVDDAANKLGVATYAIHQGNQAIVFDTFPTLDQAA